MRNLILATATALSMAAAPAAAQHAGDASRGSTNSIADKRTMTPSERVIYDAIPAEQRSAFDGWGDDRQVLYFGWTDALRGYYWSLSAAQQDAWWYLTPQQQATIFQIQDEEARQLAWNSVLTQVASIEAQETSPATPMPSSSDITYVSNAMVQAAPAPRQGEYPICKDANASDNCINAWAAGERGSGVTRPLDYWPGESASDSSLGG